MSLLNFFKNLITPKPKASDVLRMKMERNKRVKVRCQYEIKKFKIIDMKTGNPTSGDMLFDIIPSWDIIDDQILEKMCLNLSGEISGPRAVLTALRTTIVHLYHPQTMTIKLFYNGRWHEEFYDRKSAEYADDHLDFHKEKEFYPVMMKLISELHADLKAVQAEKEVEER